MGLLAGTGLSRSPYADVAVNEAITLARQRLQGQEPDLAIVFASVQHDQNKLLASLVKSLPSSTQIVGGSDAGEITELGPEKKSLAIMLLKLPDWQCITAVSPSVENSRSAGKDAAKQLMTAMGGKPSLCLLLSDGLVGDGTEIIAGMREVLGEEPVIAGGGMGDDFFFRKTYQYHQGQIYSGSLVVVGLRGPGAVAVGMGHGWRSLGFPGKVTKARGNQVIEINGQPAVQYYEQFFGQDNVDRLRRESMARLAITYPLGFWDPERNDWLIRYALSVDGNGALTCGATVKAGTVVDLMIGGRAEAQTAAAQAAQQVRQQLGTRPVRATLVFDSIARERLFGQHSNEEIAAIRDTIGSDVPLLGCYTYGEFGATPSLSPTAQTHPSSLFQNESVTVIGLAD